MKIAKISIENHQFTLIMVALLTLLGVFAFITMPRSEDPQVSPPGSSVIVVYPGASPEDIERMVVDPIEEAINELEDITKFNTTIEDGLATIAVEFEAGLDADEKYSDVLQKVNRVRNSLPGDILLLDIVKWSITDVVVLQLALTTDSVEYSELEKQADILNTKLERSNGVKKAKVLAYPDQQVQVLIDFEKMAQLHISLSHVINALQGTNANIPGGSIDADTRKFNLKTSGAFESLEEIENTIIHALEGNPVYLKDFAKIQLDYEEQNYFALFNGQKSVFVTITQKTGSNIFDVIDNAKAEITLFKKELSDDINLEYVFDQSISVASRLNDFFANLSGGMLLVGLVVFLAFGFNASTIIAAVIPLSIIIAVGFVDLSGYGLQQMSIVAMVIALGLLVDNAIVVVENIIRFRRLGHNKIDSAVMGVSQVGWAIVSSTVTTVFAFVPIVFMPGVTGDFIRSMPVTVIYILMVSLLLALTLTPYLSSKYLKSQKQEKERVLFSFLQKIVDSHYKNLLKKALNHRWLVLSIAIIALFSSLLLFPFVGVSFFPKAEKTQFLINIKMPKGSSINHTKSIAKQVENIILEKDFDGSIATNIGRSNPRIYYNVAVKRETSNFAQLFVQQNDNDMERLSVLISSLRDTLNKIPGTRIEIKEFEQGPPVEAPIAIKILGEDLDILKKISADIEAMIAGQKGTINIDNPLSTSATDLQIKINRDKAAIFGLNLFEIDQTVRAAVSGLTVTSYRNKNGDDFDIVLRMPYKDKFNIDQLNRINLVNASATPVPLKQISEVEFKDSPALIKHFKTQRSATVSADVLDDYSVDEITKSIIFLLDEYSWPDGYNYYIGGELESREESFGGMGRALIIAIIAIFGVLVLQFKSFSQPFIVLSALPLAIIGSIVFLFITGYSFSFTAFIGITSLAGIVINNSIILIDYTNQLRNQGQEIITALEEACQTRFIPIILTTATTIGGLLPLTLAGGTLWAPMGWSIIGGLTVSTMLTLIVVPVLYKTLSPKI